jgi:hypothetical protein
MMFIIPVLIAMILFFGWLTDFHYSFTKRMFVVGDPKRSKIVIIFMNNRKILQKKV